MTPRENPNPPASKRTLIRTEVSEAHFSGPLPPPELLLAYDEAIPGCAARILQMAEQQSSHRRAQEEKLNNAAVREMELKFIEARFGQICALTIPLAFIAAGFYAIMHGHDTAGAAVAAAGAGTGISQMVVAFMRGKAQHDSPSPEEPENRERTNSKALTKQPPTKSKK